MKALGVIPLFCFICLDCSESPVGPESDPAANTAKYALGEIDSLAQSYKYGLRLMSVKSDTVSTQGTSQTWHYVFVDTSMPPISYWFHASSSNVAFDSTSSTAIGIAVIEHAWFNSDSALLIAERNGGAQFRASNPDFIISASVGEPIVPNPTTHWWIRYSSRQDDSKMLFLSIDANTGVLDTKYPL